MIPKEIQDRLVFRKVNTEHPDTPRLIEIKYDPQPCEDCGRSVGRREIVSTLLTSPYPHWRHECRNCRNYQDPATKQYDVANLADFGRLLKEYKKINKDSF